MCVLEVQLVYKHQFFFTLCVLVFLNVYLLVIFIFGYVW